MGYKTYKPLHRSIAEADTLDLDPFEHYNVDKYPKQFEILKKLWPHLNIKHSVTKERKWVNIFDIEREGIENAFYETV